MSQEIYFSVSSEQLDRYREGDSSTVPALDEVAQLGCDIEYVNSLEDEYSSYVKEDIGYAGEIGLNPHSIHLSVFEELHQDDGYVELNTSYRNAQRAFKPTAGRIQPFWRPENLVFHPPIVGEDQDREALMEKVVRHMSKVNEINESDEGSTGDLLIENMPPIHHTDYMISSPEDIKMMEDIASDIGATEDLKYTFDTGHTADCVKMAEAMPSDRVEEIHLHNKAQKDDGSWENHIPLDKGTIDLSEFLEHYKKNLGHADIVVELKPSELDPESVRKSYEFVSDALND